MPGQVAHSLDQPHILSKFQTINTKKKKCPSGRHNIGNCNDEELCDTQGMRWAPNR